MSAPLLATLASFKDPANFDPNAHLMVFSAYAVEPQEFMYAASYFHARPAAYRGSTVEAFEKVTPQLSNNIQNNTPGYFSTQATYDPSAGPDT